MKTPTEDKKKRNHNSLSEFSNTTKGTKYPLHDTINFLLKINLFLLMFLNMCLILLYIY
uniref:Uncharacterized protein n=1 Tax=Candidatus Nitrotoga fabula TaxID=2182327 RepID=A0A2X0R6X7_9PROT|nr:protein of unknown function [Candidatus Nitrotoga fabula]